MLISFSIFPFLSLFSNVNSNLKWFILLAVFSKRLSSCTLEFLFASSSLCRKCFCSVSPSLYLFPLFDPSSSFQLPARHNWVFHLSPILPCDNSRKQLLGQLTKAPVTHLCVICVSEHGPQLHRGTCQ